MIVLAFNGWSEYLITHLGSGIRCLRVRNDARLSEASFRRLERGSAVLLHFDVTYSERVVMPRPQLVAAIESAGAKVLNARISDISKRRVEQLNVATGGRPLRATIRGAPDERLIVKTNLNSKASPEQRLNPETLRTLGYSPADLPPPDFPVEYPVIARRDVPQSWWTNPALCIQRYLSHPDDLCFRAYFAHTHRVLSIALNRHLVKRMVEGIERTNWLIEEDSFLDGKSVPAMVRGVYALAQHAAAHIGLEFGTVDVQPDSDGTLSVVDVNATPWWGDEEQPEMIEHLTKGLKPYQRSRNARKPAAAERPSTMDVEQVRRILRATIPSLSIASVRVLGEGYSRTVFVVNERFVFKFPNMRYAQGPLMREAWFCQTFGGNRRIRVPELAYVVPPSDAFGEAFIGLTLMAGRPIHEEYWEVSARTQSFIAAQIAEFLEIVHATPISQRAATLIHSHFAFGHWWRSQARRAFSIDGIFSRSELKQLSIYLRQWPLPRFESVPRKLVHGDLWPAHLLLDAREGHRLAVIDFGSVSIGDPDFDLAYLGDVSPALAPAVLRHLGDSNGRERLEKIEYYKIMTMLETIACKPGSILERDRIGALQFVKQWLAERN